MTYPTTYKDQYGESPSAFELKDGVLKIELRGIPFEGSDFSEMSTKADKETFDLLDEPKAIKGEGRKWGWLDCLTGHDWRYKEWVFN